MSSRASAASRRSRSGCGASSLDFTLVERAELSRYILERWRQCGLRTPHALMLLDRATSWCDHCEQQGQQTPMQSPPRQPASQTLPDPALRPGSPGYITGSQYAIKDLQEAAQGSPDWLTMSPAMQLLADKAFLQRMLMGNPGEKEPGSTGLQEGRRFSNMQPASVGEDKYDKWRPLVGKTRTNSLKSVFYGLKKLRSILGGCSLPITEEVTKRLLHKAV